MTYRTGPTGFLLLTTCAAQPPPKRQCSDLSVPDCLSTLPSYCLVLGVLWVCSQSCVNFGGAEIQGPSVSFDRGVRESFATCCLLSSLMFFFFPRRPSLATHDGH